MSAMMAEPASGSATACNSAVSCCKHVKNRNKMAALHVTLQAPVMHCRARAASRSRSPRLNPPAAHIR